MKKAVVVCLLIFAVSIVSIGSYLNTSAKRTKKIRLSKNKITMRVGKRAKLKISPKTKRKIKWTSSNKKIASVSKGIIKAKKAGKTRIIARIGKRKLKCIVTVKKKNSVVETPAPTEPTYSTLPPTETPSPTIPPTAIPPTATPIRTPVPEFTYPPYDFQSNVILLAFIEPYLESTLNELFPELNITEVEDQSLELYESVKNADYETILIDGILYTKQERLDILKQRIGTNFVIYLAEEDKQNVIDAINIILKNPNVEYATPSKLLAPH